MQRLQHEQAAMQEKIRDNGEKVKQNKVLPYLVGNVVEVSPLENSFSNTLSDLQSSQPDSGNGPRGRGRWRKPRFGFYA